MAATGCMAQVDTDGKNAIGTPYPGDDSSGGPFQGLPEIQTMLDFSFMYTDLRGEDMNGAYGGLPQFGAGISFATSDQVRFFLSARYGQKSGDPYYDTEGLSDEDGMTLKALPILVGLKINTSSRKSFRLYVGAAFQYAFLWEDLTTAQYNGLPQEVEASGTGTGYYIFLGPEIPLGQGGSAIGLEFGIGGSKGVVTDSSHSHNVDLTGAHARIYFTFGL